MGIAAQHEATLCERAVSGPELLRLLPLAFRGNVQTPCGPIHALELGLEVNRDSGLSSEFTSLCEPAFIERHFIAVHPEVGIGMPKPGRNRM